MAENSLETLQVKSDDTIWVLAFSAGLYQPMPPEARRDLIDRFRQIRADECARCAAIARAAPEMDDQPPVGALSALLADPIGFCQATVRVVKRQIAEAIERSRR